MIWWLLTNWGTQVALFAASCWVLNGLRKAWLKPLLKRAAYSCKGGVHRLDVVRQELNPPWRTLSETWIKLPEEPVQGWTREGDGWHPRTDWTHPGHRHHWHWLQNRLEDLAAVSAADEKHTEATLEGAGS